jgi:hypothetical protein
MLPDASAYSCLPDAGRARLLRDMTPGERIAFAVKYAEYLRRIYGTPVAAWSVLDTFHRVMEGTPCPVSTR